MSSEEVTRQSGKTASHESETATSAAQEWPLGWLWRFFTRKTNVNPDPEPVPNLPHLPAHSASLPTTFEAATHAPGWVQHIKQTETESTTLIVRFDVADLMAHADARYRQLENALRDERAANERLLRAAEAYRSRCRWLERACRFLEEELISVRESRREEVEEAETRGALRVIHARGREPFPVVRFLSG